MTARVFSEATGNLAELLDAAITRGAVRVVRQDGREYVFRVESATGSPLDVPGIDLGLSAEEIVAFIREGRREGDLSAQP